MRCRLLLCLAAVLLCAALASCALPGSAPAETTDPGSETRETAIVAPVTGTEEAPTEAPVIGSGEDPTGSTGSDPVTEPGSGDETGPESEPATDEITTEPVTTADTPGVEQPVDDVASDIFS